MNTNPTPSPAPEAPELQFDPIAKLPVICAVCGHTWGKHSAVDNRCLNVEGTMWADTTFVASENTRATAPAPVSQDAALSALKALDSVVWSRAEMHEEIWALVLKAQIKLRALIQEKEPAPASGWMDRAADELSESASVQFADMSVSNVRKIRKRIVEIIARHAPDVAKLEAEVAELKAAMGESMLSSIPRNKALEAENARLREALQFILDECDWEEGVAGQGGDARIGNACRQALAASPAPSAWRAMDSAPKDGSKILIWSYGPGLEVGHWFAHPLHPRWRSAGQDRAPRYWQPPLPEPPEREEGV